MKTDLQLQRDVFDELHFEPSVDAADIGVSVTDGVVTLNGFTKTYAEKMAAEKAVRRVAGVKAIAEELKVRFASDKKTADSEIARRILDIFAWDVTVPDDRIKVKVENGWVTLTGAVDWYFQSDAARRAAAKINGVAGVNDLIEIRKLPVAHDVRDHIVSAIKRSADIDASSITVSTEGGTVRLGGRVKAWHERDVAERAAWAAAGVNRVEDNIVVAA